MTKNLDDFYKDLGIRESSGNPKIVNSRGFVGLYQMGEAAMIEAGYYKKKPDNPATWEYNNDWTGKWVGKDGINSLDDFKNHPLIQSKANNLYKFKQWSYIKHFGYDKYVGQKINGITITESGLLAGAHLGGHGGVGAYLKSNGKINWDDGHTSIEDYIKKFADYDVSEITGNNISKTVKGKIVGSGGGGGAAQVDPNADAPSMTEDQYYEQLRNDPSVTDMEYDPSQMTEDQQAEYLKNEFDDPSMTEDQQLEYLREQSQEDNMPINSPAKTSTIGEKPNIFPIIKNIKYIIDNIGFVFKYSSLLIINIGFCRISSTKTGNPNNIEGIMLIIQPNITAQFIPAIIDGCLSRSTKLILNRK